MSWRKQIPERCCGVKLKTKIYSKLLTKSCSISNVPVSEYKWVIYSMHVVDQHVILSDTNSNPKPNSDLNLKPSLNTRSDRGRSRTGQKVFIPQKMLSL